MAAATAPKKKGLKKELREYLQNLMDQGLSLTQVAAAAQMRYDTVYGQLRDNRFQKSDWPRLAAALNEVGDLSLPTDVFELEKLFVVQWAKRRGRLDQGARTGEPGKPLARLQISSKGEEQRICKLYENLGAGDAFAFCSLDENPLEYDTEVMRRAVATALRNGATLLYIRPNHALLERLKEFRIQPQFTEGDLQQRFDVFRCDVKKFLTPNEAHLVEEKLLQIFADGGGFFSFKDTKALFFHDRLNATMTMRHPENTGVVRTDVANHDYILLFRRFVAGSLRQYKLRIGTELDDLRAKQAELDGSAAVVWRERLEAHLKTCLELNVCKF